MAHLPLDRFLARRLAARVLERIAGSGAKARPLRVLEIEHDGRCTAFRAGGGDRGTAALGSPRALPFLDGSFDAVFVLDVLHTQAPAARQHVLAEALRVARGHVVVVGPFAGKAVEAAMGELERAREELGWAQAAPRVGAWPRRSDVERALRQRGCATQVVGLGSTPGFVELARLVGALEEAELGGEADAVREALLAQVGRPPHVRQAIVAAVSGAETADLTGWARSPGRSTRTPTLAQREREALLALAAGRGARLWALAGRNAQLEAQLEQQSRALLGAQGAIEGLGLAVLEARRAAAETESEAARRAARLLERTRALEAERGELRGDLARLLADRDGLERVAAELTAALECLSQGLDGALGPHPWRMPEFGDRALIEQLREERDGAVERALGLQREVDSLLLALAQAGGREATLVHLESGPRADDGDPWESDAGDAAA
ncbi:MAG: methyltransferase domain-containing protein [Planctomycetaceae bacterium]|nr:methyltransferase domain-containing protein [Planctomycetaceae bacterium]